MHVTAHRTFNINFDGTHEQYVILAEQVTPGGLESHTVFSATAAFIANETLNHHGDLTLTIENATLHATCEGTCTSTTGPSPTPPATRGIDR